MDFRQAARASTDPRTPEDERREINRYIYRELVGDLSGEYIADVSDSVRRLLTEQELLHKAVRLQTYSYQLDRRTHDALVEARGGKKRGHTAILHVNEYGVIVPGRAGMSRWVEKPGPGNGFAFLNQVIRGLDIIKAVILTRQRQILAFCQPERDESALGFRLVRRDGEKITNEEMRRVLRIEEMLLNSGDESNPARRKRLRRDHLRGFVAKLVWDTLAYDACPIEIEATNSGKLSGYYSLPADTVRLCTEEGYEGNDEIQAIQVVDQIPHVAFTYDDLVYEVRNPRSALESNGYGYAEPEMVIRVLTAWLESFSFNAAGLSRNSIPRGFLTLLGDFDQRELNNFVKRLKDQLQGAANRFELPVLTGGGKQPGQTGGGPAGVQYLKIDDGFNELHFAKWMTLLISIVCAVYSIDPHEIHFDSFDARSASPLSGKDTEEKLAHSKDKGLIPLLSFVLGVFNDWLLPRIDPRYKLQWVGMHPEDPREKFERIKLTRTVDEVRAIDGAEPHEDPDIGRAPVNPSLISIYAQKLMAERQQQQQQFANIGANIGGNIGAGPNREQFPDVEDEGYPQDESGEHAPYGDEGPPDDEHIHTLEIPQRARFAFRDEDAAEEFSKATRAQPGACVVMIER